MAKRKTKAPKQPFDGEALAEDSDGDGHGERAGARAADETADQTLAATDDEQDLYEVLGVGRRATTEEIRKAYRKRALLQHPDKLAPDASEQAQAHATNAFQTLSRAYAVLADPQRRARYDASGSVAAASHELKPDDASWDAFFRELWTGAVNDQTIGDFKAKYRYSEEERLDIISAYLRTKGSLLDMIDIVPLSVLDDLDRFKDIIQQAIDAGEVEVFKKFPQVSSRELARRKAELAKEAKEVEAIQRQSEREDGNSGEAALAQMIKARNTDRMDALISQLESKYASKPKASKRKLKGKTNQQSTQDADAGTNDDLPDPAAVEEASEAKDNIDGHSDSRTTSVRRKRRVGTASNLASDSPAEATATAKRTRPKRSKQDGSVNEQSAD